LTQLFQKRFNWEEK